MRAGIQRAGGPGNPDGWRKWWAPTLTAKDPAWIVPLEAASGEIFPNGFANVSAFGTVALNANIAPAGFANVSAFGTPALNATIAPAGFANASAFGTVSLNATIGPEAFANVSAFGTVALNATIAPIGFADPDFFGVPTITGGPGPGPGPGPAPPVSGGGWLRRIMKRRHEPKAQPIPFHTISTQGFTSRNGFGRPTIEAGLPMLQRIVAAVNAQHARDELEAERSRRIIRDDDEWIEHL
jgi:hypothetical protein